MSKILQLQSFGVYSKAKYSIMGVIYPPSSGKCCRILWQNEGVFTYGPCLGRDRNQLSKVVNRDLTVTSVSKTICDDDQINVILN